MAEVFKNFPGSILDSFTALYQRRMPTVGDLERLARRDPLVAMHLHAWRDGHFASLESCLVSLAVQLAMTVEQYRGYCTAPAHASPAPDSSRDVLGEMRENLSMKFVQDRAKKVIQDLMGPPKPAAEAKPAEDGFVPPIERTDDKRSCSDD